MRYKQGPRKAGSILHRVEDQAEDLAGTISRVQQTYPGSRKGCCIELKIVNYITVCLGQ